MTKPRIIALVGGTGHLGQLIANRLLDKPGVEVRLLVRVDSRDKAKELVARGAQLVEGGVGTGDGAALAHLVDGASAVVSALQGGQDVIIDAQRELLRAARAAGVRRFVPSDYSMNLFALQPGENVGSDLRRDFAEVARAEKGEVEVVHVLNGAFLDVRTLGFLGLLDVEKHVARIWGDGTQPMDFTTMADGAAYIAEVAVDDRPLPRIVSVAGEVTDFNGLVRAYEEATGHHVRIEHEGTLDDLDKRIADVHRADPKNVLAYKPLMYLRAILSGRGKLPALMNDRYPEVDTTGVAEFFARMRG